MSENIPSSGTSPAGTSLHGRFRVGVKPEPAGFLRAGSACRISLRQALSLQNEGENQSNIRNQRCVRRDGWTRNRYKGPNPRKNGPGERAARTRVRVRHQGRRPGPSVHMERRLPHTSYPSCRQPSVTTHQSVPVTAHAEGRDARPSMPAGKALPEEEAGARHMSSRRRKGVCPWRYEDRARDRAKRHFAVAYPEGSAGGRRGGGCVGGPWAAGRKGEGGVDQGARG